MEEDTRTRLAETDGMRWSETAQPEILCMSGSGLGPESGARIWAPDLGPGFEMT